MSSNRFKNKNSEYIDSNIDNAALMPTEKEEIKPLDDTNDEITSTSSKSILDEITPEKSSKSKYMTIYLKEDLINNIKKHAKSKNMTTSKLISIILGKVLED